MRRGSKSLVFNFGKHRGRHIDQVDDSYLQRIVDEFPNSDWWWKAAANALTSRGKLKQQKSKILNVGDLLFELKDCTRKKDLPRGRELHKHAVKAGIYSNIYVAAALINLYAKCGKMEDAITVFNSIHEPNVVCWNVLILGYADNGQGSMALDFFSRMKIEGKREPDSFTYLAVLKACTLLAADGGEVGKRECLERGRQIHLEIGCHMNNRAQNTLINLYAKCGSMEEARTVFDSIKEPDVVCWNVLIHGYADNAQGSLALDLFSRMKDESKCTPSSFTYLAALKACTLLSADGSESGKRKCLERGRQIHSEIGNCMDHFAQNTLINLYGKCGSMEDARTVYDSIQEPNVVCWNAIITGYAENGQSSVALNLFSKMKNEGKCAPNSVTYLAALKACTLLAADGGEAAKRECLKTGRQIFSEIGYHSNHFAQNTLISLCSKCGSMEDARTVFNSIQKPDVVSWNAIIMGYADNGQGSAALDLFSTMKDEGHCAPNSVTYLSALKACTLLAADGDESGKRECLEKGRHIHYEIGHCMDIFAQNALINLYGKCGNMEDAKTVFDSIQEPDVVSWNAIIIGYADNGQGSVALDLFFRMKDDGRYASDSFTYVAALKACTFLAADGSEAGKKECLEKGRHIHSEIGRHMNQFAQNRLINLYARCGSMEDARTVFDSIQDPDVVSWTAIIMGYADDNQGSVALDLFSRMKDEGRCAPDSVTYIAALKACCSIGALAIGRRIHLGISEFNSHVVTCLVDFYAKCGNMEEARKVFHLHPQARIVSTWNALLTGYARFGDTASVFSLFAAMQDQGFHPDDITFVCVLSCCSHAGLVEKAWEYLELMPTRYELTPSVMHYSCMIDLLGRANKLDEAVALLQKMPCDPNAATWTALLGACRKWKNAEIGIWAFKSLMDLNGGHASAYVLMAEIYGSKDMWEEQERVLEACRNYVQFGNIGIGDPDKIFDT